MSTVVPVSRRVITIRGIVQGVGMRPFVYRSAHHYHLRGRVLNDGSEVRIEVEGHRSDLDALIDLLQNHPPPASRIEHLSWYEEPERGVADFTIDESHSTTTTVRVGPDIATCPECLAELNDPSDRRYRYPFLNCTQCGPRLTIVEGVPYDRGRTTMAAFPMCPQCEAEYQDPIDRRFHAQPTACPVCGPTLTLRDRTSTLASGDKALERAIHMLRAGSILAIKGLGGYHLVCDARNDQTVRTLRQRKHREEKPFAVMAANVDQVRELAHVNDAEHALLTSPRRPIVLLDRRPEALISPDVSPGGNPLIGVMLPYTPLHYLLIKGQSPLVMTSGNFSDEPIAYREDDASSLLGTTADALLTHNRKIQTRCDDGVWRLIAGQPVPIRRSRGDAPTPIPLPFECPVPVLAVGGELKNTFALGHDSQAILSHHLGDLDNLDAFQSFVAAVDHYQRLFQITPEIVVHDAHPDYATTRYARTRSGVRRISVQHHHAHLAACMAEHQLTEDVIGVTFDGTGYGEDTTIWGGEFLMGGYRGVRRMAHLRPVPMPGGEQAIREPWRMAASYLHDAGLDPKAFDLGVPRSGVVMVTRMIERGINTPMTSSGGRLFDGVAALVGVCARCTYEGQAAIELEWRAASGSLVDPYPYTRDAGVIDIRPMIRAIAQDQSHGLDPSEIACRFHATLALVIGETCRWLTDVTGIERVILSGGVFLNNLLTSQTVDVLTRSGLQVYRHRWVPPGDGGLSLGQLVIAAHSWRSINEATRGSFP